ncbi:MAG: hypothetical protein E7271_00720 [Lachnospiraceae bacterium]|nr:hypothetical protein [Lachnospiraceae bacterium]
MYTTVWKRRRLQILLSPLVGILLIGLFYFAYYKYTKPDVGAMIFILSMFKNAVKENGMAAFFIMVILTWAIANVLDTFTIIFNSKNAEFVGGTIFYMILGSKLGVGWGMLFAFKLFWGLFLISVYFLVSHMLYPITTMYYYVKYLREVRFN